MRLRTTGMAVTGLVIIVMAVFAWRLHDDVRSELGTERRARARAARQLVYLCNQTHAALHAAAANLRSQSASVRESSGWDLLRHEELAGLCASDQPAMMEAMGKAVPLTLAGDTDALARLADQMLLALPIRADGDTTFLSNVGWPN